MYIIGVLLYLLIVATMILTNGIFLRFIDPLNLLFVVGSIISTVVATGSYKDVISGFRIVYKNESIDQVDLNRIIKVFNLLFNVSLISGFIGLIIGIIFILTETKDLWEIGPMLASSLTTVFYGLIIGFFIFLPAKVKLEVKEHLI